MFTIGLILLVVGVIVVVAGYLLPGVPPGAVNAGWALVGLGIVLIIIDVLIGALGHEHLDHARSSWGLLS